MSDGTQAMKQPEPVNWKLCTCLKWYTGGQDGPVEGIQYNVNARPTIIRPNPKCPERTKPGHG